MNWKSYRKKFTKKCTKKCSKRFASLQIYLLILLWYISIVLCIAFVMSIRSCYHTVLIAIWEIFSSIFLSKKDSGTGTFPQIFRNLISKNTFFYRRPPVAVSGNNSKTWEIWETFAHIALGNVRYLILKCLLKSNMARSF